MARIRITHFNSGENLLKLRQYKLRYTQMKFMWLEFKIILNKREYIAAVGTEDTGWVWSLPQPFLPY